MFNMGWFWLIVLYSILMGLISLLYSAAAGVCMSILYLYKLNWPSVIIHSIAGILATISFVSFYIQHWATMSIKGVDTPLYSFMWNDSPLRVILLTPGFISIFIGIIYVMSILPIVSKVKTKNEQF
jgi:hypothetical protein